MGMEKPERNIWHLIFGMSGLSVLGWFMSSFSPANFLFVALFFLIVAVMVFFSSLFVFKSARRAILVTIGVIVWLVLRLLGLREIWYPFLLVLCLISLEILFQRR